MTRWAQQGGRRPSKYNGHDFKAVSRPPEFGPPDWKHYGDVFCTHCGLVCDLTEAELGVNLPCEFPGAQTEKTAAEWCASENALLGCLLFTHHRHVGYYLLQFAGKQVRGEFPGAKVHPNRSQIHFPSGSTLYLFVDGRVDYFRGMRFDFIVGPMFDDDATFNLAGVPLKGQSKGTPPGYTSFPKGRGTYHAREHLKTLGGYWNKDQGCWFVPSEHAAKARQLIKDAEAGRLSSDLPPPAAEAPGALTCWECGTRHYLREVNARGGNPEHFYCGCGAATALDARTKRAVR